MARLTIVRAAAEPPNVESSEQHLVRMAGKAADAANRLLDKAEAIPVPRRLDEVMGEMVASLQMALRTRDRSDKAHPMAWLLAARPSIQELVRKCANSTPVVRRSITEFADEFDGELEELGLL